MIEPAVIVGAGVGAASALGSLACTWHRAALTVRRGRPSGTVLFFVSLALPGLALWAMLTWSVAGGLAAAVGLLLVRRIALWRLSK